MIVQTPLKKLNLQYRKVKTDAKKLMLKGDMRGYFQKLMEVLSVEDAYQNARTHEVKAA